jgi:hypothetical protein
VRRDDAADRRRRRRRGGQVLHQHLAVALADERHAAGDHLVEHDAEGVDVGAVIDVAAALALLGGHVRRRAHHQAGAGAPRARLIAGELGDAEVEQLDEVALAAARGSG